MRVGRLGNGLAVQLPDVVVQALSLREGDEIEVELAGQQHVAVAKVRSRERALAVLQELSRPAPASL